MEQSGQLLAKPYDDRQLLVVVDEIRPPESKRRLGMTLEVVGLAVSLAAGSKLGAAQAVMGLVEKRSRQAANEGIHIATATHDDIRGVLFPPGHPRRKVVYVGHPFLKQQYIPFASFHRVLFEQKVSEALELLAGLGATSVKVRQVLGSKASTSFTASAGVPLQGATIQTAGNAESRREDQRDILASVTLSPTDAPRVPDGLFWYPHERFWHGLAKMRLENGLKTYSLEVNYEEDYGINAGLSAKIAKIGFDLGGTYSDFESTKWVLQGEFAPLEDLKPVGPTADSESPDV